jgi:hypothetical protein
MPGTAQNDQNLDVTLVEKLQRELSDCRSVETATPVFLEATEAMDPADNYSQTDRRYMSDGSRRLYEYKVSHMIARDEPHVLIPRYLDPSCIGLSF